MKPTIGRIVHYKLSPEDAAQIMRRRTSGASISDRIKAEKWPLGAQAHIGNDVYNDLVLPAMIVAVWPDEFNPPCNLQVFLDGCDVYWATSRREGAEPGTWSWPAPSSLM